MLAHFFLSRSCAISWPERDEVIMVGGVYTMNVVSVYRENGWQVDLPPLLVGRANLGCSSYVSQNRRVNCFFTAYE